MLERGHPRLSLRRQWAWRERHRSSRFDVPRQEHAEHRGLMRLRDAPYPRPPVYRSRRMMAWGRGRGDGVNRRGVGRLMGAMGLEAICPRPRLRAAGLAATGYLYVLQ